MLDWYEISKRHYNNGLWTIEQVKMAVKLNNITEEQYKEITGEEYEDNAE